MLQVRWTIVKGLARSWYRSHIANDMCAHIILHSMIIKDDVPRVDNWSNDEAGLSAGHATPPVIRGLPYGVNVRLHAEHAQPIFNS